MKPDEQGGGATPPEQQEAPQQEAAPQAAPEPSGPWADQLSQTFEDESQRAQVDSFLRENIQPYVTQLEQNRPPEEAAKLYQDLQNDPVDTYLAITEELYGPEAAQLVEQQLFAEDTANENADFASIENAFGGPEVEVDPDWQRVKDRVLQQEQQELYDQELNRVKTEHPELEGWEEHFHPFVVSAEGDFDQAYAEFNNWLGTAKSKFLPTAEEVPDEPPAVVPEGAGTQQPPIEENYGDDLGAAIDDFLDDTRQGAPPVLGTV